MHFRFYPYLAILLMIFTLMSAAERESAILGGIGTGKIEIDSNGRLGGITINHNPHQPINDPAGCFTAIAVESEKETIVKRLYREDGNAGAMKTVRVKALYPFAEADYEDPGLPVNVHLKAFSPVTPGNIDNSCFPAAVFEYTVENPGEKDLAVTMAMSWRNLIGLGGGAKDRIDLPGRLQHKIFRSGDYTGILLQHQETDAAALAKNALGEQALVYRPGEKEKTAVLPLWHPENDPVPFRMFLEKPDDFLRMKDAEFSREQSSEPRPAAAAAARKIIPAGEARTYQFTIVWRMPHVMSKEGVDYGAYYAKRRQSIDRILGDLRKTIDRREWDAFYSLPATLPDWLQDRMRNGMAVLARDGVFLADGQFSLITSNPDHPGNLGSPEERLADASFFLQCFPDLLRSELELMTDCQLTDGEVPSAVGNLYNVVGNGNIPGGLMGSPDSTAAYVMLIYHYYLWTGDREFLEDKYPHIRYALQWLSLRDRNFDAIPEGSSLWPWAGEGVSSLFSGSLALAAYRVGEELEQIFRDLEFQSWCTRKGRMIVQNMISQLWTGDFYHPFFDPKRPDSPDSRERIAGQLPGEWYALQMGWRSFLPENHLQRLAQVLSRESTWKSNASSDLSEPARRYGFAPAFTGPFLRHYGFLEEADRIHEYDSSSIEPAWWSYFNAASGLALDMNRRCLIVGPTAKSDSEFQCPFSTPFYSGSIRYIRSSLAGLQECEITLDRAPDWRDAGLQQIAFALPAYTDANEMMMQVYHNDEAASGQDFSRESMRVFGFQPALKVKKGDTLRLHITSANGPKIIVNVDSRDIYNYGGKCSIERIGLSLPSVSFYLTNLLRQSQLVSLLLTNPAGDEEYTVFVNGEKRPLPIPSQEPIPMMLPQSSISMNDVSLLRMTVGSCKDAALKLASLTGMDSVKKELWDLQEEVNRLVDLDINLRGVRMDIIPAGILEQFKAPKTDQDNQALQKDLNRLNDMRRAFLESVQEKSGDPVLASEIMGYFAPIEMIVGVDDIRSASQAFSVNIRASNPALAPIRGRVSLDPPEGWSAYSDDEVAFDDRSDARRERRFRYTVNAPADLWQNRYPLNVILSGAWNDSPFRKIQTAYVGHQFLKRWMIIGPFSNDRGEGFGKMNPPEINIQLKETYPGIDREVGWSEHEFDDGYIDLNSVMTPNDNAVAYAYTSIYSPREHNCQFHVGCNGDLKLFLNYKEIYAKRNVGKNRPGGEIIIHPLYEGWNHLVVKLSERLGPWGFYFEIYNLLGKPIEGMQFALDKAG